MPEQKKSTSQLAKATAVATSNNQTVAANAPQAAPAAPAVAAAQSQQTIHVNVNPAAAPVRASRAVDKTHSSAGKSAKGTAKVYRNPRNLGHGTGTHRPIGPRGSVVLYSDNPDLDRNKATKGVREPHKTIIRFKDTKGNIHEHHFPGRAAKKWDDLGWIKALNKWRYQTINRKFKRDPGVKKGSRGKWSIAEKRFLKDQIKKRVEIVGDRLIGEDWKIIAKAHNEKFAGQVVKKGEQLLSGVAANDYTMTERSAVGIRAAFDKMEDLQEMVEEIIAELTDDESSDGEATKGVVKGEEEKHGGDLDHHLEDPSDDEDEGRRPASNQTGAVLASAC